MLSKVLTGADVHRAQSAVFSPAAAGKPASPPRETPPDDEARALRARIHQLESELAAAKREAFDAGARQGEQRARAEMGPVIEKVNASIAGLTDLRHDLRTRAEKDVVQLALLIARRVLHRDVSVDPGALTALARVVFERLSRSESYRVTVHPQFAGAIQSALPGHFSSRVEVETDAGLGLGAFIVHSPEGTIDASIDTQLDEIGRGLTDRLAGV